MVAGCHFPPGPLPVASKGRWNACRSFFKLVNNMTRTNGLIIAGLALSITALGQTANKYAFPAFTGKALVPVVKVSSGRVIHRFFDTSPLSPSGRYLALFRFPQETRSPKPGEVGEVILVDRQTGKERVVAQSRGWEMQLGANVQWGGSDNELYFNDVDPATWNAFAVQLNPLTGKSRRMEGTVFMASTDGKKLASYNLVSSRRAQVGYGVVLPDSLTPRNIGPVATDGIDITDTRTGKSHPHCQHPGYLRKVGARHRHSEPAGF